MLSTYDPGIVPFPDRWPFSGFAARRYRLQNMIDNYAQGRNPWFSEPAVVLSITDGGLINHPTAGTTAEFNVPMPAADAADGSELTKEPFRWDQRLFNITLRLSGTEAAGPAAAAEAEEGRAEHYNLQYRVQIHSTVYTGYRGTTVAR